jgi:hypothetical protein
MSSLLLKRPREDEAEIETETHSKKQAVAVPIPMNMDFPVDFKDCLEEMLELLQDHDAFLSMWLGDETVTQDAGYLQQQRPSLWQSIGESVFSSVTGGILHDQIALPYRRIVDTFIREGALLHKSQLALKVRLATLYILSSPVVGPAITVPIVPRALLFLSPTLRTLLENLRRDTRLAAERVYAEQQGGPGAGALRLWSQFEDDVLNSRRLVAQVCAASPIPIPPRLQSQAALTITLLKMLRRHQEVILQVVNEIHELSDVAAQTESILRDDGSEDTYTREANTELAATGRVGHAVTLPLKLEYVRITRSMTRSSASARS